MKKIISVLIILSIFSVCSLCSSFADGFTIHSGVTFGMTHDEVIALEKTSGFEVGEYKEDLFVADDMSVQVKGTVAGTPDATIYYMFGKDDSLHEAFYDLYDIRNYDSILSTMGNKYGEPNTIDEWINTQFYHSNKLSSMISGISFFFTINKTEWYTWLLDQKNGTSVSIDLVYLNITDNNSGKSSDRVLISYALFTDEEISTIIENMTNEVNDYQNEMNNDL